jgi:hypothetical protein
MAQTSIKAIPLLSLDSATLAALTWTSINAPGLAEACFWVRVINRSSVDIYISFDGVNYNDIVQDGGELYIMPQTNSQPNAKEALMAKGTIIYAMPVLGVAGIGQIYVAGYYV